MSDDRRKFMLKVDAEHYSLLKEYSEYTNKSEQHILNRLVNHSLNEYAQMYRDLKKGYLKMGEINLEISKAFTESENEVFDRMDD